MKKVSILSLHLGYGGIEKCVVNLANILCKNYEVEIATSYRLYEKSAFPLDERVKIVYLNKDLKPNHESLRKALQRKNPVKIIKEGLFAIRVLYYRRKTMINYIRNSDAEVIISTRDIFNTWLGKYGKKEIQKIGWEHNHYHGNYRYANHIMKSAKNLNSFVLVSKELQKFYEENMKNTSCQCIWIPNFIDEIPEKESSLKDKSFISIGRLSKEKGYMDLLKLYEKIQKKYPDWDLHIIGDGPEKETLEDYIKDQKLKEKVILHGFQGKEEINRLLQKSSIYLMTSYTESFGIVLIEAMSHGIPCIAYSSAEGAKEIIRNEKNGFLISNRSEEEMLKKIEDLILNPEKRIKMGKEAKKSILPYTSEVVEKKWNTLIESRKHYD